MTHHARKVVLRAAAPHQQRLGGAWRLPDPVGEATLHNGVVPLRLPAGAQASIDKRSDADEFDETCTR